MTFLIFLEKYLWFFIISGQEMNCRSLLQSFGMKMPALAKDIGADINTLINMDEDALCKLLTSNSQSSYNSRWRISKKRKKTYSHFPTFFLIPRSYSFRISCLALSLYTKAFFILKYNNVMTNVIKSSKWSKRLTLINCI